MGFIQLPPLHLHLLDDLLVMGLGALGSDPLEAMPSLQRHVANIRGAFVTDAPALAFQEPYHRLFGQLTAGHQGALP
jgi:hypothetical protein